MFVYFCISTGRERRERLHCIYAVAVASRENGGEEGGSKGGRADGAPPINQKGVAKKVKGSGKLGPATESDFATTSAQVTRDIYHNISANYR